MAETKNNIYACKKKLVFPGSGDRKRFATAYVEKYRKQHVLLVLSRINTFNVSGGQGDPHIETCKTELRTEQEVTVTLNMFVL